MSNLVEVIKRIVAETVEASKPATITYGEVMKVNPLEIRIEQKLTLPEEFFVLTKAVTDHYIDMTVSHVTENRGGGSGDAAFASHNHDYSGRKRFLIHNGLKVGEKVILLRVQGGQKYIVLDRVFDPIIEGEWQ
jgi:sortase (surface protein transpeptidase)